MDAEFFFCLVVGFLIQRHGHVLGQVGGYHGHLVNFFLAYTALEFRAGQVREHMLNPFVDFQVVGLEELNFLDFYQIPVGGKHLNLEILGIGNGDIQRVSIGFVAPGAVDGHFRIVELDVFVGAFRHNVGVEFRNLVAGGIQRVYFQVVHAGDIFELEDEFKGVLGAVVAGFSKATGAAVISLGVSVQHEGGAAGTGPVELGIPAIIPLFIAPYGNDRFGIDLL